ncbi:probable glutathione S-transferase 5 [Pomacea canaliculata]|uniref:probable glutathione S-transferase 5 n=1 Tax=Pomacea canaliculata TaxID=400727 RepID=UPI000D72D3B2|nr:probable glutathione S-transferase 5 [Pomacea canaliculata]
MAQPQGPNQVQLSANPHLGGKNYGQSMAIAAFLAREFGLYGKGNVEAMRVDEAINVCLDFQKSMMQLFHAKDDEKKAEVMKTVGEDLVKYFTMLENLLKENGSNGFFVGSKLTWADLFVFDHLERADKFKEDWGTSFPELKKLKSKVESIPAIKKYLSSRPVTAF